MSDLKERARNMVMRLAGLGLKDAAKILADYVAQAETQVDLIGIPEGWWLYGLHHNHTPIVYAKDRHEPFEKQGDPWTCELQHFSGGKLTRGHGLTAQEAVHAAITEVELRWFDREEER